MRVLTSFHTDKENLTKLKVMLLAEGTTMGQFLNECIDAKLNPSKTLPLLPKRRIGVIVPRADLTSQKLISDRQDRQLKPGDEVTANDGSVWRCLGVVDGLKRYECVSHPEK